MLFLRASNQQLVDKKNVLFKLSYLNSNFALTLGCLGPNLNNPVQGSYDQESYNQRSYDQGSLNQRS